MQTELGGKVRGSSWEIFQKHPMKASLEVADDAQHLCRVLPCGKVVVYTRSVGGTCRHRRTPGGGAFRVNPVGSASRGPTGRSLNDLSAWAWEPTGRRGGEGRGEALPPTTEGGAVRVTAATTRDDPLRCEVTGGGKYGSRHSCI